MYDIKLKHKLYQMDSMSIGFTYCLLCLSQKRFSFDAECFKYFLNVVIRMAMLEGDYLVTQLKLNF